MTLSSPIIVKNAVSVRREDAGTSPVRCETTLLPTKRSQVMRAPSLRMECRLWQRKRRRSKSVGNTSDRMPEMPMACMKCRRRYASPKTVWMLGAGNRPCPAILGSLAATSWNWLSTELYSTSPLVFERNMPLLPSSLSHITLPSLSTCFWTLWLFLPGFLV